jgi:hypothetical protein
LADSKRGGVSALAFAVLAVACALMRFGSKASLDVVVYTLGFWASLVLALVFV